MKKKSNHWKKRREKLDHQAHSVAGAIDLEGTEMSSPNYVSMEEIPLEDNERDSIEYKILMAYAQRRLSASIYKKILKNETNAPKFSSLIRSEVEIHHQRGKDGSSQTLELQSGMRKQQSKKKTKQKHLSGYCLPFFCSRAEQEKHQKTFVPESHTFGTCTESLSVRSCHHQTSEKANVNNTADHPPSQSGEKADVDHIADKLAKLVTSRPQSSPSDVMFKTLVHSQSLEEDGKDTAEGNESEGNDEKKTIQIIVALLRKSGDQLEEKFKKDKTLYQQFKDMLSYTFFERVTDTFLEDVSADSTNETESQLQCAKVAFTLEIATRLTAVDNHPMNLVMGFGSKYLKEHFSPWIRDQGGWEKALTSLDQEEVE
ncbi:apoptosis facilitator Bcl-2-like protein 14 [Oxyura jamaicensis]|uniref:apoptosis facilitator Bcl-2-like protein 14 n=1 Tax=Oxyura jamaicensis TaxID=8884 RepID=UPI0015A6B235|nr:apoptosis facilitator Bcl-2-like protein 14 [Oxyura jamaicensis]